MGRRKVIKGSEPVRLDLRVQQQTYPHLWAWIMANREHATAIIRVALEAAIAGAGGEGLNVLVPGRSTTTTGGSVKRAAEKPGAEGGQGRVAAATEAAAQAPSVPVDAATGEARPQDIEAVRAKLRETLMRNRDALDGES